MAMDKQVNEKIHIKKDEDSDKWKTMPHEIEAEFPEEFKELAYIVIDGINYINIGFISGFLKRPSSA
mgnify:CR=1 FL=1